MSLSDKNCVLFEDENRNALLPFTFTRPVGEIRIGILTIREKWEKWTGNSFSFLTQKYLSEKFPLVEGDDNILINGAITPNQQLIDEINHLAIGEVLMNGPVIIACCTDKAGLEAFSPFNPKNFSKISSQSGYTIISKLWHIYECEGVELESDFKVITRSRKSAPISGTNSLINPDNIFAEEGAKLEYAIIDASTGPVYIGKNAEIMIGSLIRGSLALCENSQIKMGAKIYGPTTVGPYCKVGGEVTNSVFFGYSNKTHDGYVGNSVIGEWCNIGAGTNTSNLKNTYATIKMWSYVTGKHEDTGMQFCGTMMGDYSRCGINTMFNTGTVVGICSNIFGSGYPGEYIPSFSWGGSDGYEVYQLSRALETLDKIKLRRQFSLTEADKKILTQLFPLTEQYKK